VVLLDVDIAIALCSGINSEVLLLLQWTTTQCVLCVFGFLWQWCFINLSILQHRLRHTFVLLTFYQCNTMLARYLLSSSVHSSVCPSIRWSWSCTKTAKHRTCIQITELHDSAGTVVLWCKRSIQNSDAIAPNGGAKCRWGI